MHPEQARKWRIASELLIEILELPEVQQHAEAKRRAANLDVEGELLALLDSAGMASLLDLPGGELFETIATAPQPANALKGQEFDGWVLGDEIGHGGMSVVYHAFRAGEGYEQHAALKILAIAFRGPQHLASFVGERRILSELTHPGIARLIDGGVGADGTPYLVMEFIDGQRIDHWCAENQPSARDAVRLMERICGAAAHAHRHLVVHRDINPANVLVDTRGRPVLVDFGIAKLLGGADSGQTVQAFTPQFAAPEQQRIDGVITTATDIYGLGMLLKTLVPAEKRDKDLNAIVRVATHNDPEQRYNTARAMANDLVAWLEKRPIAAGPDAFSYRVQKFVQRNRRVLAVASLAMVVSLAALFTAWQHAQRSELETQKRRAVGEFLLGVFEQADIMQAGTDLRVTELLGNAADRARNTFADDPETLVALLTLIASGQTELTNYDATADLLFQVERLLSTHELSGRARTEYLLQRAKEAHELGRLPEAAQLAGEARTTIRHDSEIGELYLLAGATEVAYLVDAEQYQQALALAEELNTYVEHEGASPSAQTAVTHRYAVALEVNGDIEGAYSHYEKALELQAGYQPNNSLGRAAILSDYGVALYFDDDFEGSESVNREVLAIYQQAFEAPHPRISSALHNIAFALVGQERLDEAVNLLSRSYAMSVDLHGAEHIDSLLEQATLAALLVRTGQYARAEAMFRENLDVLARIAPDMHIQRGAVHSYLGDLLLQTGRFAESIIQYERAAEFFSQLPDDHVRVVEVRDRLAELEMRLNNS